MPHLLLKPDWPGTFRRTVRDAEGEVVGVLEFQLRDPVAVEEDELAALKGDVGKALVFAQETPDGYPTAKPDYGRTKAFVENTPWPPPAPEPGDVPAEVGPPKARPKAKPKAKPKPADDGPPR